MSEEKPDWSWATKDCGDAHCILRLKRDRGGMHTNGGCQHLKLHPSEKNHLIIELAGEVRRMREEKFFVIQMGSGRWYQEPVGTSTGLGFTLRSTMTEATMFTDRPSVEAAAERLRRGGNINLTIRTVSYSIDQG